MENLERERDFYRDQCNHLGARLLHLQKEYENLKRDIRVVRTGATLIQEMYQLIDAEVALDQIGKKFLQILLGRLDVYGAALLAYHSQAQCFAATHSLGFPKSDELSASLSCQPVEFDFSKPDNDLDPLIDTLSAATGAPFIALAFDARAQVALAVGNLVQDQNLHPPFDETFQQSLDSALSLFISIAELKRIQESLRISEERYRMVVDNANEGILVAQDGVVKFFNPKFVEMTGYPEQEILFKPIIELIHPDDRVMVMDRHVRRTRGEQLPSVYSFKMIDKEGTSKWLEINAVPFLWEGRPATLNFLSDISRRKQAEEQIRLSLEEKEVLLREIHHRVKNNLQVISSLLYLQSLNVTDEQTLRLFQESQSRVQSMALVHENLYRSTDLARIDFAHYAEGLIDHLSVSYGFGSHGIELIAHIEKVTLDIDKAIPCGLLLNELISNSLKHAFPNGRTGEIRVEMGPDKQGNIVLVVKDNGAGLSPDFQLTGHQSLGLQLVDTLVKQIKGNITFNGENGATFKITFSETEEETETEETDQEIEESHLSDVEV